MPADPTLPCSDVRDRLGAWRDGELNAADSAAIARHVASCATCAGEERDLRALAGQIADLRTPAPPSFSRRVAASLDQATSSPGSASPGSGPSPAPWRTNRPAGSWAAIAASLVLSAASGWLAATLWYAQDVGIGRVQHDVVTAHLRALATDSTVQVASADPHTVKPWFAGRLELAPTIRDLSAAGFPLAGGRLDIVDGKRVAVAVYRRRLHTVSVFMWRAGSPPTDDPPKARSVDGYNVVAWRASGIVHWAISDLNAAELVELARQM